MYIPAYSREDDINQILAFMQRYSFATIISNDVDKPVATHLPLVIEQRADRIFLLGHFAKANKHWQSITANTALIIFSEPHAYISPVHYDHVQNVPTWNYVAVHAYGKARVFNSEPEIMEAMEKTILCFERNYLNQWNELPEKYRKGMIAGIVAFEIEVTLLEAKKKLSQNRSEAERKRIIGQLGKSEDSTARSIAGFMRDTF